MTIEIQLKDLIIERFGSMSDFAIKSGIPNSTLASIMSRGVLSSNMKNICALCSFLNISIDALVAGRIAPASNPACDLEAVISATKSACNTATIDGAILTSAERDLLCGFIDVSLDAVKMYHANRQ